MNGLHYTNFESNLSMRVMHLPVKFEFDRTQHFELESGNRNVDGQTNGQKTDRITGNRNFDRQMNGQNYTNFERILAVMVIYVPFKFEFD